MVNYDENMEIFPVTRTIFLLAGQSNKVTLAFNKVTLRLITVWYIHIEHESYGDIQGL